MPSTLRRWSRTVRLPFQLHLISFHFTPRPAFLRHRRFQATHRTGSLPRPVNPNLSPSLGLSSPSYLYCLFSSILRRSMRLVCVCMSLFSFRVPHLFLPSSLRASSYVRRRCNVIEGETVPKSKQILDAENSSRRYCDGRSYRDGCGSTAVGIQLRHGLDRPQP